MKEGMHKLGEIFFSYIYNLKLIINIRVRALKLFSSPKNQSGALTE
jgi:hypothetical protein